MIKHAIVFSMCLAALLAFAKPSFAVSDYSIFNSAFKKAAAAGKTSFTVNVPAGSINRAQFSRICGNHLGFVVGRDQWRVTNRSTYKMRCKGFVNKGKTKTLRKMDVNFNGYGH